MTHKLSLLFGLAGFVALAAAVVLLVAVPRAPAAAGDQELRERVSRLESQAPQMQRSLASAGARLGAVALARASAASPDEPEESSPEAEAREVQKQAEQVEKDRRHYDHLDSVARAGGGTATVAKLRENIARARTLPAASNPGELDVAAVDCNEAICRVEVRPGDSTARLPMMAAQILMPGMAGMTMRPFAAGQPAVFYLGTPGHRLPGMER